MESSLYFYFLAHKNSLLDPTLNHSTSFHTLVHHFLLQVCFWIFCSLSSSRKLLLICLYVFICTTCSICFYTKSHPVTCHPITWPNVQRHTLLTLSILLFTSSFLVPDIPSVVNTYRLNQRMHDISSVSGKDIYFLWVSRPIQSYFPRGWSDGNVLLIIHSNLVPKFIHYSQPSCNSPLCNTILLPIFRWK